MNRFAHIAGTGSFAPEKVLDNAYFNELLGQNVDEWLTTNLGIKQRHICSEKESTADLAIEASRRALDKANVRPEELDLILLATDTPEYISPASSAVVQYKLGAKNAANFDINCACAGFVTALDTGAKYIMSDPAYENVLVIGAYAMSKYIDWSDKYTCTIFADGAGAAILQASETPGGFLGSKLIADGQYHDFMGIYAGGTQMPLTKDNIEEGHGYVRFVKKFPPDTNSRHWPRLVRDLAKKVGVEVSDIDFIIFTQININTIREVMHELELPMERTHCIMDRYGYTGSACIPMALDEAVQQKKLRKGDLLVLVGSGGGFSMACDFLRWG
ncbi:MAG: 3-oxoacyl-ACP synthase III family protein [bacterium]